MENKAFNQVHNDILSKVLQLSEDPSQFADYLTQQIRELIGARTIVIAVKAEFEPTKIFSVFPTRRTEWANQNEVLQLAELTIDFEKTQYLGQETSGEAIALLLKTLEIDKAIAIPLIAANRKVGSILLLDILDEFGIESIVELLTHLSGVFALVIRNSILYQNMDNLVAIKTNELQKKNNDLEEAIVQAEKSEMQTRDILQTAMDGFWIVDQQGRFLDVNEVACKIIGYSPEEMLQMKIADIEVLETPEIIKSRIDKINKSGDDRFESKHRCKDGSVIDVEISIKLQGNRNLFVCFFRDITDRKKAERELKESEFNLRKAQQIARLGSWKWTIATDTVYWSEELFRIHGLEPKPQAPGFKEQDALATPESRERLKAVIDKSIQNGESYEIELEHISPQDKNIKHTIARGEPDFDSDGKIIGFHGTLQDITDRKKAEEELRRSEERFSLAMKASNDGLFDWNLETNEIYYSPGWKKMLGYEDHELPNDFSIWENHTELEDAKRSWEMQQKLISKQIDRFELEFKMKHKKGHWVDILSRAEAIFNNFGKAIRIVGTHVDITIQKRAEQELKLSEQKYRLLFQNLTVGFALHEIILNAEGKPCDYRFLEINPAFETLTGLKAKDIIGKTKLEVLPNSEPYWVETYGEVVLKGKIVNFENYSQELNKHFQVNAYSPEPGKFATVFLDITERKEAEQNILESQAKLRKALEASNLSRQTLLSVLEDQRNAEKEIQKLNAELEHRVIERTSQLEAANKELESFSYSVSHDLRSPLRHINGFAEILTKQYSDQLPEDARKHLNTITGSAKKMGTLIDDLLSFSRTGRAELKKSTFKMNRVIEDALEQITPSLKDRKIDWKISQLPEVNGDYNLLRLAWVNLLDNAVKYTKIKEKAVISIGYREEKKELIFYIKDNGVGFDMQYAQKLFGVFQRLHSSSQFEGTGIGLANVQRIILRHGGRIWAEAKTDKGAIFYFSIPE